MRLPAELRQRKPRCKVAWYLHTPFPTSEIYRILPVRRELLEGLLQADLVGFQTYDYARHFLSACSRVLEVESSPKGIEYENHYCAIGVYPIGIDTEAVSEICRSPAVSARVRALEETFAGRKILLGVDRLDYIKGMYVCVDEAPPCLTAPFSAFHAAHADVSLSAAVSRLQLIINACVAE